MADIDLCVRLKPSGLNGGLVPLLCIGDEALPDQAAVTTKHEVENLSEVTVTFFGLPIKG